MSDSEYRNSVAERSAEIALTTIDSMKEELKEKDIRLDEAFALIDDKDKEIERQRIAMGEMELRIKELQDKPSKDLAELQIRYDLKCQEYNELKAIESQRTAQHDFKPASQVQSPKVVWVAAVNAYHVYKGLHEGSMWATSHNEPWKKVLFEVAVDGQLKDARLEGS
jgi:hypothetical protein